MKYRVGGRIQPNFNAAVGKSVRHCLKHGDALDIEVVGFKGKILKVIVIESVCEEPGEGVLVE